jgi:hypothetical protein
MQFLLFRPGILGHNLDHNLAVPVLADGTDRQAWGGGDARYALAHGSGNPTVSWSGSFNPYRGFLHVS